MRVLRAWLNNCLKSGSIVRQPMMITKKSEMAEWILDFFRRSNVGTGQIVMLRNVQNKLLDLNPKERDLFTPVANELIENGYFTYEEGTLQCLRLTQKGFDYIYNPEAELDCCYDVWEPNKTQAQYLANWRDSFVNYIQGLLSYVASLEMLPNATENDKKALAKIKTMLVGLEVLRIESDLASGVVKTATIEAIARLNKDIVDICLENMQISPLVREFWTQMIHLKIDQDKRAEMMRLKVLKIPVE